MKNILLICLLSFVLTSCFFQEKFCDCMPDSCSDAILFSFDADSANSGFKFSEVDTVFIYQLAKGQPNILDSAIFILRANNAGYINLKSQSNFCGAGSNRFSLNYDQPFSRDLVQDFDYRIVLPRLKSYSITNVEIETARSTGNCKCDYNSKKQLLVDGVLYDRTGYSNDQNAIVLTK